MKRLFSLCILLAALSTLSAQQIPNGNFRYWNNYLNPNGWGTWASAVYSHNVSLGDSMAALAVLDSFAGDFVGDSITVRLTVDTFQLPGIGTQTLSGFICLGGVGYVQPPTGIGLQFGAIAYGRKPDTLFIDYKYSAAAASDTGLMAIVMTHWDTLSHSRLPILSRSLKLSENPTWQRRVPLPLTDFYNASLADSIKPDTMQIIIYASVAPFPARGTTLWVDTVYFDRGVDTTVVSGIRDTYVADDIAIYPNPAREELRISISQWVMDDDLRIYDLIGRQVYAARLSQAVTTVDTHDLPAGLYQVCIISADGRASYRHSQSIMQ